MLELQETYTPTDQDFENLRGTFASFTILDNKWFLAFLERLTAKHFAKGDQILAVGGVCNHVMFIASGLIHSFYELDGKQNSSQFFFENSLITEYASFVTRKPTDIGMEALEACNLLMISYDNLQDLYKKVPSSERVGRIIAETICIYLINRTSSLLLESPEQRYLKLISSRPKVMQRVPLYLVAGYLGITPEALSRIRKRISEA